jgi:hypothetical protein
MALPRIRALATSQMRPSTKSLDRSGLAGALMTSGSARPSRGSRSSPTVSWSITTIRCRRQSHATRIAPHPGLPIPISPAVAIRNRDGLSGGVQQKTYYAFVHSNNRSDLLGGALDRSRRALRLELDARHRRDGVRAHRPSWLPGGAAALRQRHGRGHQSGSRVRQSRDPAPRH